jgi:hypothetical protein
LQAFKLVQLGICAEPEKYEHAIDLRSRGLWYPNVPSEHLALNQSAFTSSPQGFSSYQPMYWVHFGKNGVGTSLLSKVTLRGGDHVTEILPEQISIAWIDDRSIEHTSNLGHSRGEFEEEMAIDGSAGEVIQKLEITDIPLAKELGTDDFDYSNHLIAMGQVKFIRVSQTYRHGWPPPGLTSS